MNVHLWKEEKMKNRRIAGLALFLALFVGSQVMGLQEGAEQSQAPLAGGSCLAAAEQVPQPVWLTGNGCYQQTRCLDDQYCWDQCPTANSAACVNNVCQFSLPGSGPGGGGNSCPYQSHCVDDSHCVFFGGITGTCVSGLCVC
jgi:hypothetical protein